MLHFYEPYYIWHIKKQFLKYTDTLKICGGTNK